MPNDRERAREREGKRERETDEDRYKVAGSEFEAHRSTTTAAACETLVGGPSMLHRRRRFSPLLSDQMRQRESE